MINEKKYYIIGISYLSYLIVVHNIRKKSNRVFSYLVN